ncbi:MAG: MTH1187 family thiamine-binding protein [Deltaproteobacteria bacterium]|nr:MTH1187 family thiamine-binding protein [Deltaproteobacteria bacterium]
MAIAQLTVVPLGTGSTSLSAYVAQIQRELAELGLTYTLTPMGTVLEGSVPDLLAAVARLHELPFTQGAQRVMTLLNLDDRRDKAATAQGKLDSVRRRLAEDA